MRRILPYLGIAVLIGLIYDGVVFYSRWSGNREAERQREQKEAESAKRTVDLLGDFRISDFHAIPPQIKRGSQSKLCYATVGAKNVRLDPPVAEVWPTAGRCLEVSPRSTTAYTLTAEDGSGHSATGSVTIIVNH